MNRFTVRWRATALADLETHGAWLGEFDSAKPKLIMRRIREAAMMMERLGDIGRPGRVAGTREFSVPTAPYILVYTF